MANRSLDSQKRVCNNGIKYFFNNYSNYTLLSHNEETLEFTFEAEPCYKFEFKLVPMMIDDDTAQGFKTLIKQVFIADCELNLVNLRRHNYVDFDNGDIDAVISGVSDPKKQEWAKTVYYRTHNKLYDRMTSYSAEDDVAYAIRCVVTDCEHTVDLNKKVYGEWVEQAKKAKQTALTTIKTLAELEDMPIEALRDVATKFPNIKVTARIDEDSLTYRGFSKQATINKVYEYGVPNDMNYNVRVRFACNVDELVLKPIEVSFGGGSYMSTSLGERGELSINIRSLLVNILSRTTCSFEEQDQLKLAEATDYLLRDLGAFNELYEQAKAIQDKYNIRYSR